MGFGGQKLRESAIFVRLLLLVPKNSDKVSIDN